MPRLGRKEKPGDEDWKKFSVAEARQGTRRNFRQ